MNWLMLQVIFTKSDLRTVTNL